MAAPSTHSNQWIYRGALFLGLVLWWVILPPFHIVPIERVREDAATRAFDPEAFAEKFWTEALPDRIESAVDIGSLIAMLDVDRESAANQFGHRLGLSGKSAYFVSGTGWIQDIQGSKVLIALSEGGPVSVQISSGPTFGNAVRDGSGLLNVSDFGNSQDFNAISSEINRRIEERVLPELKGRAAQGMKIHFVGGVEVSDLTGPYLPLKIVPVRLSFP